MRGRHAICTAPESVPTGALGCEWREISQRLKFELVALHAARKNLMPGAGKFSFLDRLDSKLSLANKPCVSILSEFRTLSHGSGDYRTPLPYGSNFGGTQFGRCNVLHGKSKGLSIAEADQIIALDH